MIHLQIGAISMSLDQWADGFPQWVQLRLTHGSGEMQVGFRPEEFQVFVDTCQSFRAHLMKVTP